MYPLKESNLVLQRNAIVVLTNRRKGYKWRNDFASVAHFPFKATAVLSQRDGLINPTESNSDNPLSCLSQPFSRFNTSTYVLKRKT